MPRRPGRRRRPAHRRGSGPMRRRRAAALAHAHGEPEADTAAARGSGRRDHRTRSPSACHDAPRLTVHDLSLVVEAALIEAGHFDVAKALVIDRVPRRRWRRRPNAPRLIRRSGDVAAWSPRRSRSRFARRSCRCSGIRRPRSRLPTRVDERVRGLGPAYVPIETVQDIVQEELVLAGHMRVAERYIVYRAERAMLRGAATEPPRRRPLGRTAETRGRRAAIAFASIGLDLEPGRRDELERGAAPFDPSRASRASTCSGSWCSTRRRSSSATASSRGSPVASCCRTSTRRRWGGTSSATASPRFGDAHARGLRPDARARRRDRRIDPRLLEYDLDRLAAAIDPTADLDFDFLGLQTLVRPLPDLRQDGRGARRLEAPQIFWLRVAMGVCLGEPEDERDGPRPRPVRHVQEPPLLLVDADAVQRGHAALAAVLLLPLLHRRHAVLDRRARHRRERDVLEVGGRPRRLVDGGARHGLAHRVAPTARARASCRS